MDHAEQMVILGVGALLEELMETGWEVFTKYVRHGKTYLAEL
jgi:hypothetical protein